MNKRIFFSWGLLACLLVAARVASAQGTVNMATSAVPFLRINPDARGGGMGELGIATTPDASSGLYNTAKLPFTPARSGVSINYAPWLRDIVQGMYLLQASGYHRLDTLQAIAAGVRYFNLGDASVTDFSGTHLQTSQPREFALDIAYSRKLAASFSLALGLRYINSRLVSGSVGGSTYQSGQAFAADVSLFWDRVDRDGRGFSVGLSATNLGTKIGYTDGAGSKDYLPANLGIGLAYTFVFNDQNKLQLGLDVNKLLVPGSPRDSAALQTYHSYSIPGSWVRSFDNAGYGLSGGGEYNYDNLLFLRAGYHWEDKTRGNQNYLTAGVGLRYGLFELNFSYIAPSSGGTGRIPLSNTYKFGLSINK